MKISRKKRSKKSISVYKHLFNIKPPYKVLVDGVLVADALTNKIYLKEQIPVLLNDSSYLYSTRCVLNSLNQNGSNNPVSSIIRRYQIYKCNHSDCDNTSANDCILSITSNGNAEGFLVASNDQQLILKLRKRGVPVIRLLKNVLVLDKPGASLISQKIHIDKLKLVKEVKQQKVENKFKKPKKKEPNPLSCLKKKKKSLSFTNKVESEVGSPNKRKRYKKIKLST